jgi:hypothetical protein
MDGIVKGNKQNSAVQTGYSVDLIYRCSGDDPESDTVVQRGRIIT